MLADLKRLHSKWLLSLCRPAKHCMHSLCETPLVCDHYTMHHMCLSPHGQRAFCVLPFAQIWLNLTLSHLLYKVSVKMRVCVCARAPTL